MLKQELIHSHILVAIFCGWEPQKPNKEFPNGYLKMQANEGDEQDHTVSNDNILEELPYQTDWNYLMAAWDKFATESADLIHEGKDLQEIQCNVGDAIIGYNIDLAFKELVRGIDTINNLKLQES